MSWAKPADASATPSVILVVDDDERNRSLLRAILETRYAVVEAENGQEAIDVVGRRPIDLVLLDVMMPGMTGIEVCRRIKAFAGDRFLPVVLVTALSEQNDRNEGLAAGADDFLTKPVDRHELHLRLRALLALRAQEAETRRQLQALREADALKRDLVSLLVHDIRSPLSGMIGLLQLIDAEISNPETHVDVETALAAGRRISGMLEDLLDVRRIEDGNLTLARTRIGAESLLGQAVALVESEARARGVHIEVDAESGVELVVDGKMTSRALANLVGNAARHAGGDRMVSVVARAEPGTGRVRIDVADRGCGVPDRLKPSLFQKFGALATPDAEGGRRGFGLGLYMVRLVASAHDGVAEVLDRPGGGAIFRLTLPNGTP